MSIKKIFFFIFCLITMIMTSCTESKISSIPIGLFSININSSDRADNRNVKNYHAAFGSDGIIQSVNYSEYSEKTGSVTGVINVKKIFNTLYWEKAKDVYGYNTKFELEITKDCLRWIVVQKNLNNSKEKETRNVITYNLLLKNGYLMEKNGIRSKIFQNSYIEEDLTGKGTFPKFIFKNDELLSFLTTINGQPCFENKVVYSFNGNSATIVSWGENLKYSLDYDTDTWRFSPFSVEIQAVKLVSSDMKINIINDIIISSFVDSLYPFWKPFIYNLIPEEK